MAYQREIGSANNATDVRDLLDKFAAFATSQHVETVAIAVAGTGYAVGDTFSITHAGAYLLARFEVTAEAGGVPSALRILDGGAFADRIATLALGAAGGTGYVVNDVFQIQGGTARAEGKGQVTGVSGGVVTTMALFESGGAYSSVPAATDAVTVGIGPSTYAGDDALVVDTTMTGIIGAGPHATTNIIGTGSSLTVNITLEQTGWDITERDRNDLLVESDFQKQVTFKGDATGLTNKPFFSIQTREDDGGVVDRFNWEINGHITHNSALTIANQPTPISPSVYLAGDEDEVQNIDFSISADDSRIVMATNINPAAGTTDDNELMQFHAGFLDTFASETEDPYPMMIFGSSAIPNVDPSVGSLDITGLGECVGRSAGQGCPCYFYSVEVSDWVNIENSEALNATQAHTTIMYPMGRLTLIGTPVADRIGTEGPISFYTGIGSLARATPTIRYMPIPGTVPEHLPLPLTVVSRPGGTSVGANDTVRGQVRGVFWITASTGTGSSPATITDFTDDYITIGTDRYRVFHNHIHTDLYQYICIKEDVDP